MTLGQRIQELRKRVGLSQEALGEALGVSRQAVSKWEADGGIPELDTLIAMSRLFGITIGELLGVEAPVPPQEEERSAGISQEEMEAILRRYSEESRQKQQEPEKHPIGSWIIAACAVVAAVVVAVAVVGKIRDFKNTISDLRSQIYVLQSDLSAVHRQVGGLSTELREILEEQNSLISSFEYEVVSFDVESQTVDLRLAAALKTHTDESRLQFALGWIKVDESTGSLVSETLTGPLFTCVVTIPMNFHLEVKALITDETGAVHDQPLEVIYGGMHPGEFRVTSYSRGTWANSRRGVIGYQVDMTSNWPEQIYPVQAEMVVTLNGEEVFREDVSVLTLGSGEYKIQGELQISPFGETDNVQMTCIVTDNYGRTGEFQLPLLGDGATQEVEVEGVFPD